LGHPCHKLAVLFPAARIVPPAPLRTLLSIGLTFFFCALKRRYLDQDTLAFVAATRPTKTNNHRRKTAVPFGTTRESSIPSGEVLQMIQISTAQTQGLFPIEEEELTLPNHLATIRALGVTKNLENNEVFGPSCHALFRAHGSTTYAQCLTYRHRSSKVLDSYGISPIPFPARGFYP
jgi:hypothetical protein